MKLYQSSSDISTQPIPPVKVSSFPMFSRFEGLIIGSILAPISLFLGVLTLCTLLLLAFGNGKYMGSGGQMLVIIFVPLIVLLSLANKQIGNKIFLLWSALLIVVLIIIPILAIMYYIGLVPILEYLNE